MIVKSNEQRLFIFTITTLSATILHVRGCAKYALTEAVRAQRPHGKGFLSLGSKVVYVLYWSMAVMAKIDTKVHIFIKLSGYM